MDELTRLIEELNDEDWRVRSNAAKALGQVGNPDLIGVLIGALDDQISDVRRSTVQALVKIGPRAIRPLTRALEHRQGYVRLSAAEALQEALVKIGSPDAIPTIIEALKGKDEYLCSYAAKALVEIASCNPTPALRTTLPSLLRLVKATSDPKERFAYRDVLQRIWKATIGLKDLPVTATAPTPAGENLPVIATAPAPVSGESLPVASAAAAQERQDAPPVSSGLRQRLGRLFRVSGNKTS